MCILFAPTTKANPFRKTKIFSSSEEEQEVKQFKWKNAFRMQMTLCVSLSLQVGNQTSSLRWHDIEKEEKQLKTGNRVKMYYETCPDWQFSKLFGNFSQHFHFQGWVYITIRIPTLFGHNETEKVHCIVFLIIAFLFHSFNFFFHFLVSNFISFSGRKQKHNYFQGTVFSLLHFISKQCFTKTLPLSGKSRLSEYR